MTSAQERGDRSKWPWLPGTVLKQVDLDEWHVCVEDDRLVSARMGARRAQATPAMSCSIRPDPSCYLGAAAAGKVREDMRFLEKDDPANEPEG